MVCLLVMKFHKTCKLCMPSSRIPLHSVSNYEILSSLKHTRNYWYLQSTSIIIQKKICFLNPIKIFCYYENPVRYFLKFRHIVQQLLLETRVDFLSRRFFSLLIFFQVWSWPWILRLLKFPPSYKTSCGGLPIENGFFFKFYSRPKFSLYLTSK